MRTNLSFPLSSPARTPSFARFPAALSRRDISESLAPFRLGVILGLRISNFGLKCSGNFADNLALTSSLAVVLIHRVGYSVVGIRYLAAFQSWQDVKLYF